MIGLLLGRVKGWMVGAALAVAALMATYLAGRKSAKTDAKIDGLEKTLDAERARNEADDMANAYDDPVGQLRDEWRR